MSIASHDKRMVEDVVRFVGSFTRDLSAAGRFMLACELLKLMKPELDEMQRNKGLARTVGEEAAKCSISTTNSTSR